MSQCDLDSEVQPKRVIENAMSEESTILQKILGNVEGEVKDMKTQLAALKKERLNIFSLPNESNLDVDLFLNDVDKYYSNAVNRCQNQHCAMLEVKISQLRKELIDAKSAANEERYLREQYDTKYRELDTKIKKIFNVEEVQDLETASNRFEAENSELKKELIEIKDVIDQLKTQVAEKTDLYNEYRTKYIEAQAELEELRSRMQEIDIDRKKSAAEVDKEIKKLKSSFDEQLAELTDLPEVLQGTAHQMEELKDLYRQEQEKSLEYQCQIEELKIKLQVATSTIETERINYEHVKEINMMLYKGIKDCWTEDDKTKQLLKDYEKKIKDLEFEVLKHEEKYRIKAEEFVKLQNDHKEIEKEFNKIMNTGSSKYDNMKRSLGSHIKQLEQKYLQTHNMCLTYKKERDEVRTKMQQYINSLQSNYDLADIKLKQIQIQIAALHMYFQENAD